MKNSYKTIIGVSTLYFLSYLILSMNGEYKPVGFGIVGGNPDGTFIVGPKYGYYWGMLGDNEYTLDGDRTLITILYTPLLYFDRKFWHTPERALKKKTDLTSRCIRLLTVRSPRTFYS